MFSHLVNDAVFQLLWVNLPALLHKVKVNSSNPNGM